MNVCGFVRVPNKTKKSVILLMFTPSEFCPEVKQRRIRNGKPDTASNVVFID
jgi:hypothetical protein